MSLLSYRRLFHAKAGSPVPHTEQYRRPALPSVPRTRGEPSPAAVPPLSLSLSLSECRSSRWHRESGGARRGAAFGTPRPVQNAAPDRKPGAGWGPPSPGQLQPWLFGSSCHGSSQGAGKRGRSGSPLRARPASAGEGPGTRQGRLSSSAPHHAAAGPVFCNSPRSSRPLL